MFKKKLCHTGIRTVVPDNEMFSLLTTTLPIQSFKWFLNNYIDLTCDCATPFQQYADLVWR